jgi:hypothetical protein
MKKKSITTKNPEKLEPTRLTHNSDHETKITS